MPKRLPAMPPVQPTLVNKAGYQRGAGIASTAPLTPSREGTCHGGEILSQPVTSQITHYFIIQQILVRAAPSRLS